MAKPLLPKLIQNHSVGVFTAAGEWDDRTADELKYISDGLDVDSRVETPINSIPDIWARPLLFEMALFNQLHPLHSQILGEWRGLLAMISLKEFKSLDVLKAKSVSIVGEIDDSKFLRALNELTPTGRSLSPEDTSWKNLYLFLYQIGYLTYPIGMTSPTTLVFTATHYTNHINPNEVSWFDGKILHDPISKLSDGEKSALYGWLSELKRNLTFRSVGFDKRLWDQLAGLLDNYQSSLNTTSVFSPGDLRLGIQDTEAGIFRFLDVPSAAPIQTPDTSQVRLENSADRQPAVPMFIVDRKIAAQWGVREENVAVSGPVTLADIPSNNLINRHEIGNQSITAGEVWSPDELFTSQLIVVNQNAAFPGAKDLQWVGKPPVRGSNPISVVMPINHKILEYLSPDDLLTRLKFNQGADGEIRVTFEIPLTGHGDNNSYRFERVYSGNEILDLDEVPILEVFPNFVIEGWNAYYVAYSSINPRTTFKVKPNSNVLNSAKISVHLNPDAERKIWKLAAYPESLVCYKDEEQVGLLLLNAPEAMPPANKSYKVGIDFGASGTSVYCASDDNRKSLTFENRKLTVTAIGPEQTPHLFDFFLPSQVVPAPFMSFFQAFNNNERGDLLKLLHGHTYFTDDERLEGLQRQDNIKTNLKWSHDSFERKCAKAFLSQICLQTVAELVAEGVENLEWRFSFPTAFSDDHALAFQSVCSKISRELNDLTGVRSIGVKHNTESIASATFFRQYQDAQTPLGTLFVDIGSSTSDISVWQQDNLIWQISLPFAGRDIFLDYLYDDPTVRNEFSLPNPQTGDDSPDDRRRFYAAVDAEFRKNNRQIFGNLALKSGDNITRLKNHLAFGLSGLFYYLGLGINCLRKSGQYKNREMPHFYFGGNGSQMFKWLTNGTWLSQQNPYKVLFEAVFIEAVDEELDNFLEIEMSALPKQESAFGLVCNEVLSTPEDYRQQIFSGEDFIENGVKHSWNEPIDSAVLTDSLKPDKNLNKINEFVDSFNRTAGKSNGIIKRFDFDARQIAKVRSLLTKDLADLSRNRTNQKEVVVQPLFIMALKHLLTIDRK